MKNKNILINRLYVFFFIIATFSALCIVLFAYEKSKSLTINCNANFNVFDDESAMIVAVGYDLSGGKGMITINGSLYENGKKITPINLKKYVSYTRENSYLKLTSEEEGVIISNQTDISSVKKYIPGFFLSNSTRKYFVKAAPLEHNKNAWVFSTSTLPYFICSSVK